jgi:transposase
MEYYIGLDVSQRETSICVVNVDGQIAAEGKALSRPSDIHQWLVTKNISVACIAKVGLEAGALSNWLCTELRELGLPMVCLDAYQAHEFLKTCRNKTDRNDARGLAHLVRMGGEFLRPVAIRTQSNQETRTPLTLRQQLVQQKVGLENSVTGSLKPFGIIVRRGNLSTKTFCERVLLALSTAGELGQRLRESVVPMLNVHANLCDQLAVITRRVKALANAHPVCRRLMTAPGVGHIIALSYFTAVDDPKRFAKDDDIGAYFGLTPKQFQSGDTNYRTGISGKGSVMTRMHLVQAATVLLSNSKKWCPLKAWGMKIAKRRGFQKARIAVARKLAIILHRMWLHEKDFQWTAEAARQAA